MLTEDNCCTRNLTSQNLMDSNSSSFSPDTSPILGNSSDAIHEKARKRQFGDYAEEENLFSPNDSLNNLVFLQNKQPKFDMNRLKCPCCSEQISFTQFASHPCFRQQMSTESMKKTSPLLQPSNGQADLSILFTIFQGSPLFKTNLLNRIQNLLPNDLISNHTSLLGCLAIELFSQSSSPSDITDDIREVFNFNELRNLQSSNSNNICKECCPKVNFLLPSSKALHLSLHHYDKSINNPTYLSIILTVNAISLIGCVRLAINDTLERTHQQSLFNSPSDLIEKMKKIFSDGGSQLKDFSSLLPNLEVMLNMIPGLQNQQQQTHQSQNPFSINNSFMASQLGNKIGSTQQQQTPQPTKNSNINNNNNKITNKRGRTRLTSQQLTILRSYFDINNSPTEDKIIEICSKTGLQEKVVKHWFRNTLFKERQRNKDNPYNFSVPPSTSLNLEEYEKTGKIEFVPNDRKKNEVITSSLQQKPSEEINKLKEDENVKHIGDKMSELSQNLNLLMGKCAHCSFSVEPLMNRIQPKILTNHIISKHPEESVKLLSNIANLRLPDIVGNEENPIDLSLGQLLSMNRDFVGNNQVPSAANIFQQVQSFTTTNSESQDEEFGLHSSEQDSLDGNQNMSIGTSNSANGAGNQNLQSRRNRTSISNFQSKCMFAIYEYHKTPSVQECDRLGDFIGLSRRVVQVWFQNQRAKEKKMARVNQCSMKNSSLNQSSSPNGQPTTPLNLCTLSNCILCNVHFITDPEDLANGGPNRKFDRKLIEHLFTSQHLENLIELYSKEMKMANTETGSLC